MTRCWEHASIGSATSNARQKARIQPFELIAAVVPTSSPGKCSRTAGFAKNILSVASLVVYLIARGNLRDACGLPRTPMLIASDPTDGVLTNAFSTDS